MAATSFVRVNVGGIPYSIAMSDVEKFPGIFLQCLIKNEWKSDSVDAINIQRDGELFKYVSAYIVTGHLPRTKLGTIDLDDGTLEGLKVEADYYGLEALSKECNISRRTSPELDLNSYLTIRKYLAKCAHKGNLQIDLSSRLVRAIKCIWSPFCVTGKLSAYSSYKNLFGASSMKSINMEELIAAATQSPFGRGTETIVDTSVRNSFEIDAAKLDSAALDAISAQVKCAQLAPHLDLSLRPYKLVIYKEGGHFDQHRDTVRGKGHIGTLVVILNSEYTGGELEVTHGGRAEVVTGPYSWVAMYGDCLHKINPVTSGARVSLIYDIYGAGVATVPGANMSGHIASNGAEDEAGLEEEDQGDDELIETRYWQNQPKNSYGKLAALDRRRDPSESDVACVFNTLDRELKSYDSIIICLQHLYPECQANPAFLKGGDRVLYDILTGSDSSTYDVQVVAATIYRRQDYEYTDDNTTQGALFSPAIVKQALGLKSDSESEDEDEGIEQETAPKKQKLNPVANLGRTKLVLPNNLDPDSLLDYTPYSEHTGNESQAEETVYIVAGLQVRKRV